MQNMTLDEFKNLLNKEWGHSQTIDFADTGFRPVEEYDSEADTVTLKQIPYTWGLAWVTSTLNGITITYTESFSYDDDNEDSFDAGTDGMDEVWRIDSLTVFDDGEKMNASEIGDYLPDEFKTIKYSGLEVFNTADE